MSENIEELFDEEIIGEEIADENKELNNEEQTEEQVEEITHEERVIKTENEELPQYEETYENDIFVYDESEAIEEKTEKKSFLNNVTNKSEHYVDYKTRLLANSLTFIALFIITIIFLQGAFSKTTNQMINYNEMSNLDYKVYLKENNFYESDYLGKNKVYIANLIDNIEINFRYNYNIEKPSNVDFNYSIVAKLTIDDGSSKNNYFEKEYVLLNNQRKSIKSGTNYNLNEKVKIDYAYYNNLANSFKQQFGLDTTSYLTVYLRVNKNTNIDPIYRIQTSENSTVKGTVYGGGDTANVNGNVDIILRNSNFGKYV